MKEELTLLDHLAGEIINGLLSRDLKSAGEGNDKFNNNHNHANIWEITGNERWYVSKAYSIANEMLEHRKKYIKEQPQTVSN